MKVSDVMSKEPVKVTAAESAWTASELMTRHGVSELPVLEDGRLVGIVTRGDITAGLGGRGWEPAEEQMIDVQARVKVRQFMTKPPHTVSPSTDLADACRRMADYRVGALPVVDDDGHLVGLLSVTDVLRVAADRLAEEPS